MPEDTSAAPFDLAETDRLLSTTRSVRRRLDLDRPVDPDVVLDCLRLAQQAPTGSNLQGWRWLVVTDPDLRAGLADLYRKGGSDYLRAAADQGTGSGQTDRVISSALYLAENLHRVPVMVIPCLKGRIEDPAPVFQASFYGSIIPAVWSFQLALRARGLGSVYTTLHLAFEREAAELLGIPDDVTQAALIPVAHTLGADFKPAKRGPVEHITYWNRWKVAPPAT
ncbi:MAG: nitroreductase family protein [Acidimicrobiales bacterium]|jgi:nitroreductase|nr:nitroreductase family protein [Acidimicrobiales bacterium]